MEFLLGDLCAFNVRQLKPHAGPPNTLIEYQLVEAERLAAVGQAMQGLSHK